jgi:serine/threonine protein kinase
MPPKSNPVLDADGEDATVPPGLAEPSSKWIGPYKLLQPIGEGGMGTVWMAEQEKPVRRRVALKLIKGAMADKQVIARFEAERQALAMMDHPNISRVLDAGTTETGNPYFVMELVNGIPINEYCDRHKLTPDQRLKLFVPVCKAVQHAHQKGIIHRDLKPDNVLVHLSDGEPLAKVIDFGLAKALQHQTKLTDKTMFTEFGQVVGTLLYMSPEQATMDAMQVDTRSDIYSLGVMLYELLSGSTPVDKETLKNNALLQVLEVIREQEPLKPSHRLSSSHDTLTSISERRQTKPSKLKKVLRGELDWIVMKALEKDRTRRYETASELAKDIVSFLSHDTV